MYKTETAKDNVKVVTVHHYYDSLALLQHPTLLTNRRCLILTLVTPFLKSLFLSRALFSAFKDPAHGLGWPRAI